MYSFVLQFCLAYVLLATASAEIPSYMKVCHRKDPDINKCIHNSIEQLREKLITGIPELDVPPLEPLRVKEMRLSRGPQNARLDINITNVEVTGPSKFKLRDFKVDVENVIFTFKILLDKVEFQGKYSIDAQILLLKLIGDGNLTGAFFDYECDCILKTDKVKRDNDTYIHFQKMKFKLKIGKSHINLENLFGGDPILGPASNEVLNANSDLFLDELKPALADALSDLFTTIANKIIERFTYNELFPL